MKKFNLMQVLPSLESGGVEQGSIDVANYLASLEVKNYLVSNGGQMLSYLNKKYVSHNNLSVHSKNFFLMPFVASKLNEVIIKNNIDILHIRSRSPAWLLPYIKKQNLKTVSTFHNVYGSQNILKRIYNKQLSKVDKIVAISKFVKDEIIKIYNIEPNKIRIINRGIDINFLNAKIDDENLFIKFFNKFKISKDKKIVLYPGRLTKWKGQIEFLKIIETFRDDPIIFYFVGDDKNNSYLKKLIYEIKLKKLDSNCKILGHLKKDELKIMYQCADLIISAPLKPEGFGRIVGESLSMKKIILAYNYGGVHDQLEGLDKLYKIKPNNIEELKSKISVVLRLDKNIIDNMGNLARKHIINNFSKEKMLESYLSFYQEF